MISALSWFDGIQPQPQVLRLLDDGRVDSSFNPPIQGEHVRALVIQPDGRIVIGGSFTHVHGVPRAGVARLLADGTLDPSFDPGLDFTYGWNSLVGDVFALIALPDGGVVVGGNFSHVNGAPRRNLAKLTTTGSFDPTFGPAEGIYGTDFQYSSVESLALTPEGDVLAGGYFNRVGLVERHGLVRLRGEPPAFRLAAPRWLATGEVEFTLPGGPQPVVLEMTPQLSPADWRPVVTNATVTPLVHRDPEASRLSQRFYRALREVK